MNKEDALAALLERSCTVAWNDEPDDATDFQRLEAAAIAVEDYLSEQNLPRDDYAVREVAMQALGLTVAERQSIEPWCQGFGDEEECQVDASNPCAGCRDAGWQGRRWSR